MTVTPYSVGSSPPVRVHRVSSPTSASTSSGQVMSGRAPICSSSASSADSATVVGGQHAVLLQAASPASRNGVASRGEAAGHGGSSGWWEAATISTPSRRRPRVRARRQAAGPSTSRATSGGSSPLHRPGAHEAPGLLRRHADRARAPPAPGRRAARRTSAVRAPPARPPSGVPRAGAGPCRRPGRRPAAPGRRRARSSRTKRCRVSGCRRVRGSSGDLAVRADAGERRGARGVAEEVGGVELGEGDDALAGQRRPRPSRCPGRGGGRSPSPRPSSAPGRGRSAADGRP